MGATNLKGVSVSCGTDGGFHFEISETGLTVRNRWTLRLLKPQRDKAGYYRVWGTSTDGKRRSFMVHRLVALAHLTVPENYADLDINHKDGNKGNNNASNLEWVTKSENQRHALRNGLFKTKRESTPERLREQLIEGQRRFKAKKKMNKDA